MPRSDRVLYAKWRKEPRLRLLTAVSNHTSSNHCTVPLANKATVQYVSCATDLISRTFIEDPMICFFLSSMSDEARLAYLPDYIRFLMKAAQSNDAIFQEANEWSCCAVWMPPGKQAVGGTWTVLRAGFLRCLWNVGFAGVYVRSSVPSLRMRAR